MNDLEAALAGPTITMAPKLCRWAQIIADMRQDRPELADTVTAALIEPAHARGFSDAKLATLLTGAGYSVNPSTLSKHRNGVCICQPKGTS